MKLAIMMVKSSTTSSMRQRLSKACQSRLLKARQSSAGSVGKIFEWAAEKNVPAGFEKMYFASRWPPLRISSGVKIPSESETAEATFRNKDRMTSATLWRPVRSAGR